MYSLTRGERFKDARIVHNQHGSQSMDEVHAATGVSASMIKDLEDDQKERSVGYDKIAILAEHYGVSSDYLLGFSPYPTTDKDLEFVCRYTGLSEYSVRSLMLFSTSDFHTTAELVNDILKIENLLPNYLLLIQSSKNFKPESKMGSDFDSQLEGIRLYQNAAMQGMAPIGQSDYMRFLTSEIGNAIAEGLRKKYIPGYGEAK